MKRAQGSKGRRVEVQARKLVEGAEGALEVREERHRGFVRKNVGDRENASPLELEKAKLRKGEGEVQDGLGRDRLDLEDGNVGEQRHVDHRVELRGANRGCVRVCWGGGGGFPGWPEFASEAQVLNRL